MSISRKRSPVDRDQVSWTEERGQGQSSTRRAIMCVLSPASLRVALGKHRFVLPRSSVTLTGSKLLSRHLTDSSQLNLAPMALCRLIVPFRCCPRIHDHSLFRWTLSDERDSLICLIAALLQRASSQTHCTHTPMIRFQ